MTRKRIHYGAQAATARERVVYAYREPSIAVIAKRVVKAALRLGKAYSIEYDKKWNGERHAQVQVKAYAEIFAGDGSSIWIEINVQYSKNSKGTGQWRGGETWLTDFTTSARLYIYPDKTYSTNSDYGFPSGLLKAFTP